MVHPSGSCSCTRPSGLVSSLSSGLSGIRQSGMLRRLTRYISVRGAASHPGAVGDTLALVLLEEVMRCNDERTQNTADMWTRWLTEGERIMERSARLDTVSVMYKADDVMPLLHTLAASRALVEEKDERIAFLEWMRSVQEQHMERRDYQGW